MGLQPVGMGLMSTTVSHFSRVDILSKKDGRTFPQQSTLYLPILVSGQARWVGRQKFASAGFINKYNCEGGGVVTRL